MFSKKNVDCENLYLVDSPGCRMMKRVDCIPVSYTHLDVYKRQVRCEVMTPVVRELREI